MIKLKDMITEGKSVGEFVRFGGLSPVKQKGYTTGDDAGFHTPPARKGFYAFPKGYIELFLLGGGRADPKNKDSSNRFVYLRDKDGKKITNTHSDFEKYLENDNYWDVKLGLKDGAVPDEDGDYAYDDYHHALVKRVHPKKFKYNGEIWHHLREFVPPTETLKEKGEWVKTTMKTYLEAFAKQAHASKKEMWQDARRYGSDPDGKKSMSDLQVRADPLKYFSRDHLEVFIERLK